MRPSGLLLIACSNAASAAVAVAPVGVYVSTFQPRAFAPASISAFTGPVALGEALGM